MFKIFKLILAALCLIAFFEAAYAAPIVASDDTAVRAENVPTIESDSLIGTLWRRDSEGNWQMEEVDFLHLTPVEWVSINEAVEAGTVILEKGIPTVQDENGNIEEAKVILAADH